MSTKKIAVYTALLTLMAAGLFAAYRVVQFYHEVTRPLVPLAAPAAPFAHPGKKVTTYTFSVIQEVVVPPTPVSTQRPRRHR
ncbi:hypothetical protein [Hymenobacter negativus]|uniref:Efflux transporter periplasmic adaptor subunit n=1 Tax=Hymenobacter negativus TaxID=2795026 RepID=A0ABS0QCL5_9BACT|nr:hypothetical protein [Hymenobacter negativus]MBH8560431.1 hypothetical protein [Hymenobacter negativus]